MAARFGLTAAALADPDGRIPAAVTVAMWEQVPRIVDDGLFGLRLGERATGAGVLPVVGYVLQTSPTLGEGITRALRYQRLVQTLNRVEVLAGDDEARVLIHVRQRHVEPLRHAVDFALAFLVSLAARLTGIPVFARRARFAFAAPARTDDHRRLFGPDVRFDADVTEVAFDAAVLARPVPSGALSLRGLVERHGDIRLARLPSGESRAARARAPIVDGLGTGRADVGAVAAALRVSSRTLQRRLKDEGTSYAQLLDDARRDLAQRYVADRSPALSEVALLLGFADQTTFHRAFVRWTGSAPGAFRRAARSSG